MEDFKRDLFLKEYKIPMDCQMATITDKIALEEYLEGYGEHSFGKSTFFKTLLEILPSKMVLDCIDSASELAGILRVIGAQNEQDVIVIWDFPDDVDKFNVNYLLKYWEDIWFSTSDEVIGLFFPAIKRMIVITHFNNVYY